AASNSDIVWSLRALSFSGRLSVQMMSPPSSSSTSKCGASDTIGLLTSILPSTVESPRWMRGRALSAAARQTEIAFRDHAAVDLAGAAVDAGPVRMPIALVDIGGRALPLRQRQGCRQVQQVGGVAEEFLRREHFDHRAECAVGLFLNRGP